MTAEGKRLAAMSLAALNDPVSVEIRPLDDINADLTALGIDPTASIERAQQRARKRSRPANRLLARLDDAAALDAEIEALEKADIADVRDTVQAGVAASIAADAKRRTGVPSNVTALKRRRRVWGWSGSIVGIAACLLLFVVTRPDQLYQIKEADRVRAFSKATTAESTEFDREVETPMEPRVVEKAEAERFAPLVALEDRVERNRMSAPDAEPTESNLTSRAMNRGHVLDQLVASVRPSSKTDKLAGEKESAVVAAAPAPAPKASHLPMAKPVADAEMGSAIALAEEQEAPSLAADVAETSVVDTATEERNSFLAILVVDAERVPAKFKSDAETLPRGDLADRLDEARALIESKVVVALVTLRREGRVVDAAIAVPELEADPFSLTDSRAGFTSGASVAPRTSANEEGFELIELPKKP